MEKGHHTPTLRRKVPRPTPGHGRGSLSWCDPTARHTLPEIGLLGAGWGRGGGEVGAGWGGVGARWGRGGAEVGGGWDVWGWAELGGWT